MTTMLATLALALTPVGQLFDCSYAGMTHQEPGDVVTTVGVEVDAGSFQARLSPGMDRVSLVPRGGEGIEELRCAAVGEVVVCTAAGDRKAFVLFAGDGRFSLSTQDDDGSGWSTTSGVCSKRTATAAV